MSTNLSQILNTAVVYSNRGQTTNMPLRSVGLRLKRWLFTPVLAPLLRQGGTLRVLAAAGLIQLVSAAADVCGWSCPVKSVLGVPCPGCGLSTAVMLLVKGDLHNALRLHAAAPLVLTGMMLLSAGSLLPAAWRRQAAQGVARVEQLTGMIPFLVVGGVIYWVARHIGGF